MGGRLTIDVTVASGADATAAVRQARAVARRVEAWAARLTRFDEASDLSGLNADPSGAVAVRPTLAAVLAWAAEAEDRTGGIVDVTLLAARLAAEVGPATSTSESIPPVAPRWRLRRPDRRRRAVVERPVGVRFDIDGVAKGWLADRALALLAGLPGAVVDADGDIALRVAPRDRIEIAIADPRVAGGRLTSLAIDAPPGRFVSAGVATSGVSIHRWRDADHHLIDPRTGRPAATDVVQATVLAATAREAEALAKTAVILGCRDGLAFLDAAGARAGIVLTEAGDVLGTVGSLDWLVAA